MNDVGQHERITLLLKAIQNDDTSAADQLFSLLYDELRKMADSAMRQEAPGVTLQPTALVNEVWIKLLGSEQTQNWQSRKHFFVAASQAMRRILVDAARTRKRLKRGGGELPLRLEDFDVLSAVQDDDLIELDEALVRLKQVAPAKGTLVELRYFGGMTNAETAQHLGISVATAERYWVFAKAWLRKEMES